jgi:hypothetical protein
LGNAYSGVAIVSRERSAQNNVIGVLSTDPNPADEVNIIVGNGFVGLAADQANPLNAAGTGNYAGVTVESQTANFISIGNVIAGNDIGTNGSGITGWGNAQSGIYLIGAQGTLVGTNADGVDDTLEANVISGNAQAGVTIDGSFPTTTTTIAGNTISANTGPGVQIINGATNNTIGGSAAGTGNVIALNSGAGVEILGAASIGNQIRGNSIANNGALGIDLGGDGVTLNHIGAAVGPNNLENFPVVDVARHGSTTRVLGHFNGLANRTYILDFFASKSADPSGYGQGQRYLGTGQIPTDASGNATFDSATFANQLGASLSTEFITALATDSAGNTSEFSAAILANAGPVAINDSYLVQQNSMANVLAVLANDTDPAGDPFSLTSVTGPSHGTAAINGSSILYTPTAGYFGPDSFTYTVSDSFGDTSTATVSITVTFRPVTISGTIFQDQNDNHIQDAGESGLAGWTVQLDGGAMSVTTDASGAYRFTGVGPGVHTVSEVVQSAYIETSPRGDAYSINTSNGVDVSGKNFSNEIPTNARDNSLPGYSENGSGWTTLNSGWRGNSRTHTIDLNGKTSASWSLNAGATILPGQYEVFVSYVPAAGRATNAPYTIADNKTVLGTIAVDQTQTPSDGLYQGVRWRSLGVFTFNSGKPIVTLNANANGVIDADGVLLIPASAYAPPMSPMGAVALASPTSSASVTAPLVAAASPPANLIDHIFSNPSAHQPPEGVLLGGMASTTTATAVIDAAATGLPQDPDDFSIDGAWSMRSGSELATTDQLSPRF